MLRLVLAGLFSTAIAASAQETPVDRLEIDAYLQQYRTTADAPGISAAIAWQGKVVYAAGFGWADVGNRVPATGHTVHNIGSVSKVNAVVGIMRLVQDGVVDIDAPIQAWVPGFPDKQSEITLRHVLTHTSGIRHYNVDDFGDPEVFEENRDRFHTVEAALEIFQDDPLLFEPGAYWSYSSYATNVLHAVIEEASGEGFEHYLRRTVWEPAGMLATSFDVPERIIRGRARGYRRHPESGRLEHEPYGDVSYKYAGGGMLSTAIDQVRLGVALNHGLLLEPGILQQMLEPWTEPRQSWASNREPRDLSFQQALLWRVQHDDAGRRIVSHGGSVRGFRTALVNFPDEDLVVAVMINIASDPGRPALALAQKVFATAAVER